MTSRVINGGQVTKCFQAETGLGQSWLLSPFLFILVIDWPRERPQCRKQTESSGHFWRSWSIWTLQMILPLYPTAMNRCKKRPLDWQSPHLNLVRKTKSIKINSGADVEARIGTSRAALLQINKCLRRQCNITSLEEQDVQLKCQVNPTLRSRDIEEYKDHHQESANVHHKLPEEHSLDLLAGHNQQFGTVADNEPAASRRRTPEKKMGGSDTHLGSQQPMSLYRYSNGTTGQAEARTAEEHLVTWSWGGHQEEGLLQETAGMDG